LFLKVAHKPIDKVGFEQGALGDEGVDLLFFNLVADPVDQHRNFNCVELVNYWIHFRVFCMQDVLVDANYLVQLGDSHHIEVLMEEE
jgi:hypothetical protein